MRRPYLVSERVLNDVISRDSSHISFGASVLVASQPLQLNQIVWCMFP